ncbi:MULTISPECIES: GGDEF domain-containing protein [Methylomonas]|uniref:GGDEF domain-containing protein n=1 Tax=Methylomonas TaxID=416 RepID=UPI0012324712|nr:GGDEF domain-containing protein [Methylomonas rhizoryzae]
MSEKRANTELPSVLKKLGGMTALRDTALVEQSLLRTLEPLLGILETSFYRTDDSGGIIRAIHHSRNVVAENGVNRVVDNVEEVTNERDAPALVVKLFESARLLGKACSRHIDGEQRLICYPTFGKNEVVGYFVFQRDRDVTAEEDSIIQGVIEVFTNYFDLLDASQRDQLTGLLNRYSLDAYLNGLWSLLAESQNVMQAEAADVKSPRERYWLWLIDIDHFKSINDRFGHIIGDEVLILITGLLKNSMRRSDLLYRYGGEEFLIIIATPDEESAKRVFERSRQKIEDFEFPRVGKVTISGGFSEADPKVLPREVLNRADSALYAAKAAGRNRVFHYEQLLRDGVIKEAATGEIDLF